MCLTEEINNSIFQMRYFDDLKKMQKTNLNYLCQNENYF